MRKTERKHRILVVEDEQIVAMSLEMMLEDEGFEVSGIAQTVKEALEMFDEGSFEAVVLDVNLHGILYSDLAALLQQRGIPFIVVTGYDPEQQRANFPDDTRFLQKPYSRAALVEAIREGAL